MKHKQIIPFDIEKAKKGAKVVTKDGHSVRINNFNNGNTYHPITARIYNQSCPNEVNTSLHFTKDGRLFSNRVTPCDLCIEVEEVIEEKSKKRIIADTTDEHKQYLEYIGLSSSSDVRSKNAGKSDYSKQVIQPWTIWHSYPNITTIDKDIVKRILRTKEEGNLSPINSRILDYEKIIHDCQERIRQLKVLLETSLPFDEFKTEDDELINKQLEYYELNSK